MIIVTNERHAGQMQLVVATVIKLLKSPTLLMGVADWPHRQQVRGGY